ncbi:hypothetical protein H9P43_003801 [Blastocladiella emersonii ATCC 22665]|nr:hypothetical protein H9P43_003801 [Blastocladiella emersonii ATCC 22665]
MTSTNPSASPTRAESPAPAPAPAALPKLKRKARGANLRKKPSADLDDTSPSASSADGDAGVAEDRSLDLLADFKEARKVRARARGLDAEMLLQPASVLEAAAAARKAASAASAEDISKLEAIRHDGLVDPNAGGGEGYLPAFTGTNKTLDATKHRERFVEMELAKRRGKATEPETSKKPVATVASMEDELFAIPEHLRVARSEVAEGSVTASASMLTAIPEVDLGESSRHAAIVRTEAFRDRRSGHAPGHASDDDDESAPRLTDDPDLERALAFNHNPFPGMRWRISRKTRETLFDLRVAEDLLRDRRGRSVHGIVTNDEELLRQIEAENQGRGAGDDDDDLPGSSSKRARYA